jgi:hypothetical protein
MWEALEQTPWVKTLGTAGWMYASVAAAHYPTMFWLIGTVRLWTCESWAWPRGNETWQNWPSSFSPGLGRDLRCP